MSAPAPGHRPKPNEVWGFPLCLHIAFVRILELNSITSLRRTGDTCSTFLRKPFAMWNSTTLPQCQLQPQPNRSQPREVWGSFCAPHLCPLCSLGPTQPRSSIRAGSPPERAWECFFVFLNCNFASWDASYVRIPASDRKETGFFKGNVSTRRIAVKFSKV
jgi:hypothetical protein